MQVHSHEPIPPTHGRLIRWAFAYDHVVSLLTLGQAAKIRTKTIDVAHIAPGETVLDVGCGTGDVSIAAKGRAGHAGAVYGIDPAPEMIAVARQKVARSQIAVDFRVSAVEHMPFPDNSVDVVLSSVMMHHLPADVKRLGLLEIRRVLKPGGRLVIVDLRSPSTTIGRVTMMTLLHGAIHEGVQDLIPLLHACGFARIQADETLWHVFGFVVGWIDE